MNYKKIKLYDLAHKQPNDGALIFVIYETDKPFMEAMIYKYDGYLTYENGVKGQIFWNSLSEVKKLIDMPELTSNNDLRKRREHDIDKDIRDSEKRTGFIFQVDEE